MKRFISMLCASSCFIAINAYVDSTHIRDIFNYLPNDTSICAADVVVLLDLDNTVFEPADQSGLGSDQFATHITKKKMAETGLDFNSAMQLVLPNFFKLQNHMDMVPVEQETPAIITQLQKSGIHVMALTARSLPLMSRTVEQLHAINVDFCPTGFNVENNALDIQLTKIAKYHQGILFCNNNCKGLVILKFFERMHYQPKLVIFVDDKAHNITVVEKILQENGIEKVIGIRYGRLDHKVENFDTNAADDKWRLFLAGLESQTA